MLKIRCANEVCLEINSVLPQLGRFVLRDKGITIAFGTIMSFTEDSDVVEEVNG